MLMTSMPGDKRGVLGPAREQYVVAVVTRLFVVAAQVAHPQRKTAHAGVQSGGNHGGQTVLGRKRGVVVASPEERQRVRADRAGALKEHPVLAFTLGERLGHGAVVVHRVTVADEALVLATEELTSPTKLPSASSSLKPSAPMAMALPTCPCHHFFAAGLVKSISEPLPFHHSPRYVEPSGRCRK